MEIRQKKKQETKERITAFLGRVQRLTKGERTALKRALGKTTDSAPSSAYAAFCRALAAPLPRWESEEPWFLCACGFCAMERLRERQEAAADDEQSPDGPKAQAFARCLYLLDQKKGTAALEHRLKQLADTPLRESPAYFAEKLAGALRYLTVEGYLVHFADLLYDLRNWDAPDGRVQKAWMRAYYLSGTESNQAQEPGEQPSDEEDTNDAD